MRDEIANLSSVHQQLAHMLIVENTSVPSGFADVGLVTALLLFLTLPVPVARQPRLRQDVFNEIMNEYLDVANTMPMNMVNSGTY